MKPNVIVGCVVAIIVFGIWLSIHTNEKLTFGKHCQRSIPNCETEGTTFTCAKCVGDDVFHKIPGGGCALKLGDNAYNVLTRKLNYLRRDGDYDRETSKVGRYTPDVINWGQPDNVEASYHPMDQIAGTCSYGGWGLHWTHYGGGVINNCKNGFTCKVVSSHMPYVEMYSGGGQNGKEWRSYIGFCEMPLGEFNRKIQEEKDSTTDTPVPEGHLDFSKLDKIEQIYNANGVIVPIADPMNSKIKITGRPLINQGYYSCGSTACQADAEYGTIGSQYYNKFTRVEPGDQYHPGNIDEQKVP